MMTYEEAKKKLQEQACMCGYAYDKGIRDKNGYWIKDGKQMTPEEVQAFKDNVPVDENAILEMMKAE